MQGEGKGCGKLSCGKFLFLVIICVAAISAIVTAPKGAVSMMVAKAMGDMAGAEALKISEPKPLPAMVFIDENGKKQSIESYKGKVVALNFWALWCASCKVEKPKLDQLQADLAEKGLVVLTVSDGFNNQGAVKQYFANHNITHLKPMTDEGSAAFRALQLQGVPSTLIINKKGQEIARAQGYVDWSVPYARQVIEKALGE